ncbi:MAG: tRNA 2-selenouridine(34) synthase MnmH [Sphingobacteriales bacterium]|nr:MAG: tRNA 2-selenouridine(34) synthase MnmH [Sphingobacteriales bacterium]
MIRKLPVDAFLAATDAGPLLDVRAPIEFEAGHMPGAVSFPIFTDEERKRIGTLYKQAGHDRAVIEGLHFLGPRMAEVVKKANKLFPDKKVRMHCWRGGLRSGTMAWLLDLGGFEVTLLDSGYKSWRNHVLQTFTQPWQLVILGGMTGSGKTDLLKQLQNAGEQVIDLEGLAHHKGSSFGGIDQPAQPTQEEFENRLAEQLQQLNPEKRARCSSRCCPRTTREKTGAGILPNQPRSASRSRAAHTKTPRRTGYQTSPRSNRNRPDGTDG